MSQRRPVNDARKAVVGDIIYVDDVFEGTKRTFHSNYMIIEFYAKNPDSSESKWYPQEWVKTLDMDGGNVVYIDPSMLRYCSVEE